MAVFLKDGYTESMEGIDISGIIVAGQLVDSLMHFIGRFTGFPGAGACDDTHESFCGRDCLELFFIQLF